MIHYEIGKLFDGIIRLILNSIHIFKVVLLTIFSTLAIYASASPQSGPGGGQGGRGQIRGPGGPGPQGGPGQRGPQGGPGQ